MGTDSGITPRRSGVGALFTRTAILVLVAVALAGVAVWANLQYARTLATRRSLEARLAEVQAEKLAGQAAKDTLQGEIRVLDALLKTKPSDFRSRFKLAELYLRAGDFDGSLSELRVLQRQRPKDWEPPFRGSMVLQAAGRPDAALPAALQAARLRPADSQVTEWVAGIYLELGRAREARVWYERALKGKPDSYTALLGKGRALEQLVRYHHPISFPEMISPVEKAVGLRPKDPNGLLVLSRMYFVFKKQPEAAAALARRARDADPNAAAPHLLLAEISLSLPPTPENLDQAGDAAYQAGLRDPKNPRPPYQIGRVYLARNDVKRAIRGFERSMELKPTADAVSQLAIAYRRDGNLERAKYYADLYQQHTDRVSRRESLLRERALHPRDLKPCLELAELYTQTLATREAQAWLDAAEKLAPGDQRVTQAREKLRRAAEGKPNGPILALP